MLGLLRRRCRCMCSRPAQSRAGCGPPATGLTVPTATTGFLAHGCLRLTWVRYWTPGYWGWNGGLYIWYPGYWGPHVGYYGGVNYGFGYFGIGFVGGKWRGGVFDYNRAVMHVGAAHGWGGNRVYEDRTVVGRNTVGKQPRGLQRRAGRHQSSSPRRKRTRTMHEQHMAPTSFQTQHDAAAMHNTNNYFSHNHGHPTNHGSCQANGCGVARTDRAGIAELQP